MTSKHCVTKEDLEKADFGQGKGECTYTIRDFDQHAGERQLFLQCGGNESERRCRHHRSRF